MANIITHSESNRVRFLFFIDYTGKYGIFRILYLNEFLVYNQYKIALGQRHN